MAAGLGPTNNIVKSSRDRLSFLFVLFLVFFVLGVVETDLDRSAGFGQFVEVHAHLIERLRKSSSPATVQQN